MSSARSLDGQCQGHIDMVQGFAYMSLSSTLDNYYQHKINGIAYHDEGRQVWVGPVWSCPGSLRHRDGHTNTRRYRHGTATVGSRHSLYTAADRCPGTATWPHSASGSVSEEYLDLFTHTHTHTHTHTNGYSTMNSLIPPPTTTLGLSNVASNPTSQHLF